MLGDIIRDVKNGTHTYGKHKSAHEVRDHENDEGFVGKRGLDRLPPGQSFVHLAEFFAFFDLQRGQNDQKSSKHRHSNHRHLQGEQRGVERAGFRTEEVRDDETDQGAEKAKQTVHHRELAAFKVRLGQFGQESAMHQPHDGVAGIVEQHGNQHPGEFGEIRRMLRREPYQAEC